MAYTAYKFKPSFVEKRLKSYKSNLMKFKGHDNLVANAVRVIRERLNSLPFDRNRAPQTSHLMTWTTHPMPRQSILADR